MQDYMPFDAFVAAMMVATIYFTARRADNHGDTK